MSKKVDFNTSMEEFIAEFPEAKEIFESFGLNYQDEGNKNITTVASEQRLDLSDLMASLENAIDESIERERLERWLDKPLTNMIDHIEKKHHVFLWKKLPSTDMLLYKISENNDIEDKDLLANIKRLFSNLKNNIEEHLESEEDVLFDYIRQNEELLILGGDNAPSFDASLMNVLAQDHKVTEDILKEFRTLTSNYKLSESATDRVKELYGKLQVLEKDIQEHIKLEDAILFPRIKQLL